MKVLIAEDNADLRQSLRQWFINWGHDVVVVGSAPEAIAVLNSRDVPDLALLDCEMPEFDSLGTGHQLHRRSETVAQYLLVFTASTLRPLTVNLRRAGAGDDLTERNDGRDLGLRLEIGRALVQSHRQRRCPEGACGTAGEPAN
jgi:CheY-like chemotaxis protein